jgi:hypothetical protein
MFDEGATHQAVADKLAEQGVSLNVRSLSDWYHGGYQDYRRALERRELLRESQEQLLQIGLQADAPSLSIAGLQIAVTQLSQQLADLSSDAHKQSFQSDTNAYLRMINTLARVSKALLTLQIYKDDAAKAQAAQLKKADINRDLADSEYDAVTNKMDQVFRVRRPRSVAPQTAVPPSPAETAATAVKPDELRPLAPKYDEPSTAAREVVPLPPAVCPEVQNSEPAIEKESRANEASSHRRSRSQASRNPSGA